MSGVLFHQTAVDTAGGAQLLDEVIACYVAWREECGTVRARYEAWRSGAEEDRIRFAVYNMAVDREEYAATLYAESIDRLRRFLWPHLEP
jgi:hypothetical protein